MEEKKEEEYKAAIKTLKYFALACLVGLMFLCLNGLFNQINMSFQEALSLMIALSAITITVYLGVKSNFESERNNDRFNEILHNIDNLKEEIKNNNEILMKLVDDDKLLLK